MKYGERLHLARNHAKLTQSQLADKIDNVCTQENISKLDRGNATGSEYTAHFANACGVSAIWLAIEQGEMVPRTYSTTNKKIGEAMVAMEKSADYVQDAALAAIKSTVQLAEAAAGHKKNGTHG